jgi:hypothetical protein
MNILLIFFAILKLSSSILIDCEFKNDYIHDWGLRYSCRTKKIVIKGENRKIEIVSGEHLLNLKSENVTQYFARSLNIERFPQGLGERFVSVEVVRITTCNMRLLLKEDMANLESLKYLDLVGNKLEKLGSNAFENAPNLVEVILNNNRLMFVGSKILEPLKKLTIVSFGGNVCVQAFAKFSEEQLARLKMEIRLKCSDISLAEVMERFDEMETKLEGVMKRIGEIGEVLTTKKGK